MKTPVLGMFFLGILTNGIPPGPPGRQQAVPFNYACGAPDVSEGGRVALLVAAGSAAGEWFARAEPGEHDDGEGAGVF